MDPKVFIGKKLSLAKEIELSEEISILRKEGKIPKLTSILIGDDKASKLYLSLKKNAAERVGATVEIKEFPASVPSDQVIQLIEESNSDKKVHGIMIQLPLPMGLEHESKELINKIDPKKDVDGMRDDSPYLTPVVKAVLSVLKEVAKFFSHDLKIIVVGSKGFVGKKIVKVLKEMGYPVSGVDLDASSLKQKIKEADILVSAVGKAGIISQNMVKKGVAVIDVGSPKGDVKKSVSKKASFVSFVPGGIGPVTVSYLLENLVEAARIER